MSVNFYRFSEQKFRYFFYVGICSSTQIMDLRHHSLSFFVNKQITYEILRAYYGYLPGFEHRLACSGTPTNVPVGCAPFTSTIL